MRQWKCRMERHCLVQEPYILRVKAPPDSLSSCCQPAEPFAWVLQPKQTVTGVGSVSGDFDGSALAAPGIHVLQGGQIRSDPALGCFDHSLQGSMALYGAVAKPWCDAHGQYVFNTGFEDFRRDPKPPQLPQVVKLRSCLFDLYVGGPGEIVCELKCFLWSPPPSVYFCWCSAGGSLPGTIFPGSPLPSGRPPYRCWRWYQHYWVVRKLDDGIAGVSSHAVRGVEGEQQGAQRTSLWDSSAEGDGIGHTAAHPNYLGPIGEKVQHPSTSSRSCTCVRDLSRPVLMISKLQRVDGVLYEPLKHLHDSWC